MSTVFLYCAALGGTLLVLQFLMLLFGVGGDTDIDGGPGHVGNGHGGHDQVGHNQGAFLKLFSVQTVSTFATFFGLVGLGTAKLGWSPLTVALAATLAGTAALWLVTRLMRSLAGLQSHGNVDLGNAVGHTGSVYLRVPAAGSGHGRVLMTVQGRTVECRAISRGNEIPTGVAVTVVERTDDDVLVVAPVA